MRTFYLLICLLLCNHSFSQAIQEKLEQAINKLAVDEQFKHSIISLYVAEGKTGKTIYDKNAELGLVPASCQKIVTSASAFEILGSDYHYKTDVGYFKEAGTNLTGLYFVGRGDPTMGSFRYASTRENDFMEQLKQALLSAGIRQVDRCVQFTDSISSQQIIPRGWVWEDIGNYFGAGASFLNWRENQYTIFLDPGAKELAPTTIKETVPAYIELTFKNNCITGPKKSGDNAYIYFGYDKNEADIYGTIPLGENNFPVNGAVRDPEAFFFSAIQAFLKKSNILKQDGSTGTEKEVKRTLLYTYDSPALDSMNFWFLKKSINLYGEAFVKTIAYKKTNAGSTDSGVNVMKDFWVNKGIERSALKIIDGSGLSPANRLTTKALVTILQYAKQRPWFSSFYNALPEMNGIKMKDGYITAVRSYTGYIRSASGAEYSFAFIVNNFDGNPGSAREKMWKILDLLK